MENSTPNQETLDALLEIQAMKANPALGKTYTDIDRMMQELLESQSRTLTQQ